MKASSPSIEHFDFGLLNAKRLLKGDWGRHATNKLYRGVISHPMLALP